MNGTVWMSAVILVIIVKGSFGRSNGNDTSFAGSSLLTLRGHCKADFCISRQS